MLENRRVCSECGTVNDGDAKFCKECGVGENDKKPVKSGLLDKFSETKLGPSNPYAIGGVTTQGRYCPSCKRLMFGSTCFMCQPKAVYDETFG